jgi:hypothetical protein
MIVIIHCPYGDPDRAVGYTEEKDALPYIKKHLKSWDIYNEAFQAQVEAIASIEDAQVLIEENAIYTMQVFVLDAINPDS